MTRISDGKSIDHRPEAALVGGDVVQLGELIGIAASSIGAGELGSLSITGIYELPRVATLSPVPAGTRLYWNTAAQQVRTTAGGGFLIGYTIELVGKLDATCRVLLRQ